MGSSGRTDTSRPESRSSGSRSSGLRLSSILCLVVLVLLPIAGSLYYALTAPVEYTGRALVQFRPRATGNGGIVSNETTASSAAGYGAFLGTPSTIRDVATQIDVTQLELRDAMAVQLVPATTSLSITFSHPSPEVAAQGATALAQAAVLRAADDPLVSATVLAPAAVPEMPSTPPKWVILAAGGLLGLILATATYFLWAAWRRRQVAAAAAMAQTRASVLAQAAPPTQPQPSAPSQPSAQSPASQSDRIDTAVS